MMKENIIERKFYILVGDLNNLQRILSKFYIENSNNERFSIESLYFQYIDQKTEIGKLIDFTIKSDKLINEKSVIFVVYQWLISLISRNDSLALCGFLSSDF